MVGLSSRRKETLFSGVEKQGLFVLYEKPLVDGGCFSESGGAMSASTRTGYPPIVIPCRSNGSV